MKYLLFFVFGGCGAVATTTTTTPPPHSVFTDDVYLVEAFLRNFHDPINIVYIFHVPASWLLLLFVIQSWGFIYGFDALDSIRSRNFQSRSLFLFVYVHMARMTLCWKALLLRLSPCIDLRRRFILIRRQCILYILIIIVFSLVLCLATQIKCFQHIIIINLIIIVVVAVIPP